jgi:hypothetical protein
MREPQLPEELERVERLLTHGPRPEPSASLRRRVLDQVRSELRGAVRVSTNLGLGFSGSALNGLQSQLWRRRQRSKWQLAAAITATLLIAVSLSLGMLQASSFALQQREFTPTLSDIAWRIQQIAPQVSQRDSEYQASLRQIGNYASRGTAVNQLLSEFKSYDPQ